MISAAIALAPIVAAGMLGEAQTNAALWWILGAAGAAVMLNQLVQAWRNMTGGMLRKPDDDQARKRTDCIEIHKRTNNRINGLEAESEAGDTSLRLEIKADMTAISKELRAGFATANMQDETRASKTHSRIDGLTSSLYEMRGTLTNHIDQHKEGAAS